MDITKLILQLYYDLIARTLPGGVAIVVAAIAVDARIGKIVNSLLDGAPALQQSSLVLMIIIVTSAYLAGQLIAPLSDWVERRVVARLFPSFSEVLKDAVSVSRGTYPPKVRRFLIDELEYDKNTNNEGFSDHQYITTTFIWYDWLRTHNPDVGHRIWRIRGTHRMYGGIVVATGVALVLHILAVSLAGVRLNLPLIGGVVTMGTLSLWGSGRHYRIFQWSIINHYYVEKTKSKSDNQADSPRSDQKKANIKG